MAKKKKQRIIPLEMCSILADENPQVWSRVYTDGKADIFKISTIRKIKKERIS